MLLKSLLIALLASFVSVSANAAEVTGFKNALFGASENEVIAAAVADLGVAASDVKRIKDTSTRITLLEVSLKMLAPLDLPAVVTYVLGYQCNCLVRVTIVWNLPKPLSMDERKIALAGVGSLVDHFSRQGWESGEVVTSRIVGDVKEGSENALIFFRGQNKKGAGIALLGVPVKVNAPAKNTTSSYEANVDFIQNVILSYERDARHQDAYHIDTKGS